MSERLPFSRSILVSPVVCGLRASLEEYQNKLKTLERFSEKYLETAYAIELVSQLLHYGRIQTADVARTLEMVYDRAYGVAFDKDAFERACAEVSERMEGVFCSPC